MWKVFPPETVAFVGLFASNVNTRDRDNMDYHADKTCKSHELHSPEPRRFILLFGGRAHSLYL